MLVQLETVDFSRGLISLTLFIDPELVIVNCNPNPEKYSFNDK